MSKEMLKYCLAIVGVILGWVMVVPAFEFPDEQAHMGSISYLIDKGSMPVYEKLDLTLEMAESQKYLGTFRNDLGQNRYTYHPEYHVEYSTSVTGLHERDILSLNSTENRDVYVGSEAAKYPPLYYRFISLFTSMVNGQDIFMRLFVSRLGGLFIAFAMAVVVYKTGLLIFTKSIYAKTLTFMVLLQPMFSFVTGGVNSDNLHNLWFSLIIYLCLSLIEHGLKMRDLIALAATISLDIYTKPQGFIALPIVGIAILIAVIKFRKWKMLIWLGIIGASALVFGASQWEVYKGLFNVGNTFGTEFIEYLRFSANKLIAQNVVWYWGVFKWLGIVLPPIYWRIANRVVLLSVIGIMIYWWKIYKNKKTITTPYSVLFMLFASIIYALVIFWYDWQHTKLNGYSLGIQARYFYPTIMAHMTILMTGIISLGWSALSRKWLRRFLVILFTWLQLGALWHVISIYYPGTSLQELIIQASQYKPYFVKGNWWYFWGTIYLSSIFYLIKNSLSAGKKAKV